MTIVLGSPMTERSCESPWQPGSLASTDNVEASKPIPHASSPPSTDEILAATAHELRLPLSHIKGFVTSLRRTDRGYKPAMDVALTQTLTVVRGALQRIRGLVRDRPLRLNVPPSLPSVQMDASQMERVLANLIHNAIKYSSPGLTIDVSARITDDSELELSVDDEGPGIPAADRHRIFEPFFRGQTVRQSDVPGDGLGLAI